jgi:phage terminase large subunit
MSKTVINLPEIIGKGYGKFWKDKEHRYVVVKGSRGSKKSKTTALWIIYNMMKYPQSNCLCIRQIANTLRDSTHADLKWAINRLRVQHLWQTKDSSLEITYLPTGQKILFRGLDNPLSLTSISVPKGIINFCWVEEAYQITEDAFNKIDLSLRGILPDKHFFRIILTFNPWSEHIWLKKRFFDNPDKFTLPLTTTYQVNEWIGEQTIELFKEMEKRNPRRYLVEGLGEWGISEGLIFSNWETKQFNLSQLPNKNELINVNGMDFGYEDPTTLIRSAVDTTNKIIYIYEEFWNQHQTPDDIEKMIKENNLERIQIIADNARPEIINQLNRKGCNIKGCKKGKDSVLTGIIFIQDYKIIVHPSCINITKELSTYAWKVDKKTEKTLDVPEDANNHCIDALRYSLEPIMKPQQKSKIRSW